MKELRRRRCAFPLLALPWLAEVAAARTLPDLGPSHALRTSLVIPLARVAYCKEHNVSSTSDCAGARFTNIKVFAVPPRLSLSNCVSLWFLYGTKPLRPSRVRASVTSAKAVKDLLISIVSLMVSPIAPLFFSRSEPAKSQRRIFPTIADWASLSPTSIEIVRNRCERELSEFICVAATFRRETPSSMSCNNCSGCWTVRSSAPSTHALPFKTSHFTSSPIMIPLPVANRSTKLSLYNSTRFADTLEVNLPESSWDSLEKIASTVRGATPRVSAAPPYIVCVLPAPVCP
mmetsp:Transcript_12362/g.33354  ORF Transcript_12362/g.33354 Transcript_12362/m.33354 type:complete len:289 (+) Transcript_12362:137-1003(+)